MKNSEKDIEHLISASLDAALTEEEDLALNRTLIRDPEARHLMDDMRATDELAGNVLRRVAMSGADLGDPAQWVEGVNQVAPRHFVRRSWWLAVGSIAAALAAVISHNVSQSLQQQPEIVANGQPGSVDQTLSEIHPASSGSIADGSRTTSEVLPGELPEMPRPQFRAGPVPVSSQDLTRRVSAPPQRRIKRDVYRDYYGIRGSENSFYWIEVDRCRTVRKPNPDYAAWAAQNEM